MDARELNQRLVSRIEDTLLYLFPGGRHKGSEFFIGDIGGSEGDSLKIHTTGNKAGFWSDFSQSGEEFSGRSLVKLWRNSRGLEWKDAKKEICEFLNIRDNAIRQNRKPKNYKKPDPKKIIQMAQNKSPAIKYLTKERKISLAVCEKFKISDTEGRGGVAFPRHENGECVGLKLLKIARPDGKKVMTQEPECKPCLYGKDEVDNYDVFLDEITICEGEIEALSWWTMGIPAVSVPNGTNDTQWIDLDWGWLEQFTTIYIALDMDEAGQKATAEVIERLGKERCRVVSLPENDFNDCLKKNITPDAALKLLEESKYLEIEEIKNAGAFEDEAWEYFYPSSPEMMGYNTPWNSLPFKIRAHEVTVITGFENSGKTTALNQMGVGLMEQEQRGFIASLEVSGATTIGNQVQMALATNKPSREAYTDVLGRISDSLYLYDYVGRLNEDRLFDAMLYSHKRYGTFWFWIDSLLRVGISSDDYNGQTRLMDRLCDFVKNHKVHVALVAHGRKELEGQKRAPDSDSIKGTGNIKDLAHNIIAFWRNKEKEIEMRKAEHRGDWEMIKKLKEQPCANLVIRKQRNGIPGQRGALTDIPLWFDRNSSQYLEGQENKPKKYLTGEE